MLVGYYMGYAIDAAVIGLLMGGSPVGIAYVLEKKLPEGRSPIWWKFFAIPPGFALMYGLLTASMPWVVGSAVFLASIAAVFFRKHSGGNTRVAQMEKSLEHCC